MKIPMKNINEAMHAKNILNKAGLRINISKGSGPEGCYYYLQVPDRDYPAASIILFKHDILK